jgi:hypothetical protein
MSIAARADGFMVDMFQCISPGTSYSVAVGAVSAQGNLPQEGVTIVRLFSTVDCFIAFGTNPTAVAGSSMFLPGGIVEYFEIRSNEKFAVIQNGSTGTLYVTEGASS